MRRRVSCPVRRSDLHGNGAVGNGTYVGYLQTARHDLLTSLGVAADAQDTRLVVDYLLPARLEHGPLDVDAWVCEVGDGLVTLGYEVSSAAGTHVRAVTDVPVGVLSAASASRLRAGAEGAPLTSEPFDGDLFTDGERHPLSVRFSDLAAGGQVATTAHLDLSHEAQIATLIAHFGRTKVEGGVSTVIARAQLEVLAPMRLRPAPYDVVVRLVRVGRTSVVVESQTLDGDTLLARARIVQVNVDDDDRPTPWHPAHRESFEASPASGV